MKRLTLLEAKSNLSIDRDMLDEDIIRQSELFYGVSEMLVKARETKDKEKDNLARTEAELSIFYRKKLKEGGKPSEAQIREEVLNASKYLKAKSLYLNACSNADSWEVMKEAYTQRSFMLKELVNLYNANYFGDPTVSSNNSRVKEVANNNTRRRLTEDRNKRTRLR